MYAVVLAGLVAAAFTIAADAGESSQLFERRTRGTRKEFTVRRTYFSFRKQLEYHNH